jgi:phage shock protein PspC (stress-responsive transcriptional regulator)
MNERLYRSRDDRMLAGVAGGLADLWDADPTLIRVLWALLVIFTGGLALVVYIVMAFVVPDEPWGAAPPGAFAAAEPGADPVAGSGAEPVAGAGWVNPAPSLRESRREARAARRAARRSSGAPAGMIGGLVLIAIGGFFLARQFLPQLDFDWFWPLILVAIGVVLLISAIGRGPRDPGDAL